MPAASCSSRRRETLYRRPGNVFVARFVGFENILPFRVCARDGEMVVAENSGMRINLSQAVFGAIPDTFHPRRTARWPLGVAGFVGGRHTGAAGFADLSRTCLSVSMRDARRPGDCEWSWEPARTRHPCTAYSPGGAMLHSAQEGEF